MPKKTKCTIKGCTKPIHARGMCNQHHRRFLRHGDPNATPHRCRVLDCQHKTHARGICREHYDMARSGLDIGLGVHMFGVFGREICEKCNQAPMGGGRWCLTHFHEYVNEQDNQRTTRRSRHGPIHCGTQRGRDRHVRMGEPMCSQCEAALTDWLQRMAS